LQVSQRAGDTRHIRLAQHLTAAHDGRRFVARALTDWGLHDLVGDAEIVASELVTNALLHTSTQAELVVARNGSGVRIEVNDADPQGVVPPFELPRQRRSLLDDQAGEAELASLLVGEATTGRGLQVVSALATDWGVRRNGDGKTVWATMRTAGTAAPRGRTPVVPPAGVALRPVRMIAVPVRTALASELHLDALLRELQLIGRGGTRLRMPEGVVAETCQLLEGFALPRRLLRVAAHEAVARGDRLLDLNLLVPADADTRLPRLQTLLDDVVEHCRAGDVLSLAPAPDAERFRRWYGGEVSRQLSGLPPRPCPLPVTAGSGAPAGANERLAPDRLAAIERVRAAVGRAPDAVAVLHILLNEAVGELGGAKASVCLLGEDNETVTVTESVGYPESVLTHWGSFPISSDLPASDSIRTGLPTVLRTLEERNARYPVFSATPVLDEVAFITVPLNAGTLPALGCLVISFTQARDFAPHDIQLLEEMCGAAAEALARLASATAGSIHRQLLDRVDEVFRQLDPRAAADAFLTALAGALVPWLGEWCSVHALGPDGSPRYVAAAHQDPALAELAAELHRRWPPRLGERSIGWSVQTGGTDRFQIVPEELLPVIVEDPEQAEVLRRLGLGSVAVAAMKSADRVFGALAIANAPGRYVTDSEVHALEEVGRRAGARLAASAPPDGVEDAPVG
jgi:GAF domain-containing protein